MGTNTDKILATAMVIAYIASFIVGATTLFVGPVADDGTGTVADTTTDETQTTTTAQDHQDLATQFDFGLHNTTDKNGRKGDVPQTGDGKVNHFTVENITDDQVHTVALFAPTVRYGGQADQDKNHTHHGTEADGSDLKADFNKVIFNETGEWTIRYYGQEGAEKATQALHTFNVSGVKNLTVTVEDHSGNDATEFDFPGNQDKDLVITVTDEDGNAVEGAEVEITGSNDNNILPSGQNETDAQGEIDEGFNFWDKGGADTYEVVACSPSQSKGQCTATNKENVTITVNPAELHLEDIDGTPVTRGFGDQVDWDLRYPSNDPRSPRNPLNSTETNRSSVKFDWNATLMEDDKMVCQFTHRQGAGADIFTSVFNNATPGYNAPWTAPSNKTETDFRITQLAGGANGATRVTIFDHRDTRMFDTAMDGELGGNGDIAYFNDTQWDPQDTQLGLGSWNYTAHYADGSTVSKALTVTDPCTSRDETEALWAMQDGNLSAVKTWNNSDYALGVEINRIGPANLPEYVFNQTFDTEAPDPPVLRLGETRGDVPDRNLAPAHSITGDDIRPNGSEVHPDGDAFTSSGSLGTDHGDNGQYELDIQGTEADDFPEPANLSIEVTGPYLGTPGFITNNGTWLDGSIGAGHWEIPDGRILVRNITPMRGQSQLTITVDWDHPTEGSSVKSIKHRISEGVIASVDQDEVTVGVDDQEVTVHVTGTGGTPIPDADVTLFWTRNGTQINQTSGNDTAGHGQGGDYVFPLNINAAVGEVTAHADDQFGQDAYAEFEVVPAHDLDVSVSPGQELAGRDTEYTLNVTRDGEAFDGSGDAIELFVLNHEQQEDFAENGSSALPAATATSRDSEGNFTFDWQAEGGHYHVYVRTDTRLHDNEGQLGEIEIVSPDITWSPDTLVSKVDTNVTVDIMVDDPTNSPANGTLAIRTGNGPGTSPPDSFRNASFHNGSLGSGTETVATGHDDMTRAGVGFNVTGVDVTDGEAHLDNVTAQRPGPVYAWFQDEATGAVYAMTDEPLMVVAPNVDISPDIVCVGVTTQITATVTHPITDDPITDANFTLRQGASKIANGSTNNNGVARVTVFLTNSTQVTVSVNGDSAAKFTPKNCMSISFDKQSYTAGDPVVVTVLQRGGTTQVQGATILVDGSQVGTTGTDGSLTFDAPAAGDHIVRAQKTGFADATATVTTESATPPASFQVSGVSIEDAESYLVGSTYRVDGNVENVGGETATTTVAFLVSNAQVDSTDLTLDAGEDQDVAFQWTASSTGDINLAIKADGNQDSVTVTVVEEEPTVPGFEIVAVLAALGAAAVVLRRD